MTKTDVKAIVADALAQGTQIGLAKVAAHWEKRTIAAAIAKKADAQ